MVTTQVPIRQLQRNASELVARAHGGERIEITSHGRLMAVLSPPALDEVALQGLIADGLVDAESVPAPGALARLGSPLPQQGGESDRTLSEILQELREEETR